MIAITQKYFLLDFLRGEKELSDIDLHNFPVDFDDKITEKQYKNNLFLD